MNKKILWAVLAGILLVAGMWLFFRGTKEPAVEKPLAEKATGTHYAGGGMHTVEGIVALPTPCYALSVAAERRGPSQVLLRFTAEKTADVCAEAVFEAPFRVTFEAPDNAELVAEINGIAMGLELTRLARQSVSAGETFTIRHGEEFWVEDLKITLTGVEDDSRCPADVQCIQAGWVTLRFLAGGEEVTLRHPGDNTVPNAAVTGSYIITLIGASPEPHSETPLTPEEYSAEIRVDIHDNKG